MAWTNWTLAAYASVVGAATMSGCCCQKCYSQDAQDAQQYMVEDDLEGRPSANIYPLNPAPLEANTGPIENSQNNRLVRIRGKAPDGLPRAFDVFFGPGLGDLSAGAPGKGQFTNDDPGWKCTQGYAILRGIRPSGSTQYVKASSDSTTIIVLVSPDKKEERFILTEGATGAKVHPAGQDAPAASNLLKGQVIVAKIINGVATLAPAVDYSTDQVSVDLIDYLKKVKGAKDIGLQ